MRMRARAILFVVASIFVAAGPVSAGMFEAGHGPRAVGMGQAQVGAANDFSAAFYNPAALTVARDVWNINGKTMLLSYGKSGYSTYLELNDVDQEYPHVSASTIGILAPIGKRLTMGAAMYMPDAWMLVVQVNTGPRFWKFSQTQQPIINLGFGYKVNKWLSVGYTQEIHPAYNLSVVNLDLNSILGSLGVSLGEPSVNQNPYMQLDAYMNYSYSCGVLVKPTKYFSVGASYINKTGSDVTIPLHIPPSLFPETSIDVTIHHNWRPTRLAFGVGIYPNENLTLAFDMNYDMWSQISKPRLTFTSVGFQLIPTTTTEIHLSDVWIPRVGVEYKGKFKGRLSKAQYALRAGYSYAKSPYPPLEPDSMNIDNDSHNYSGGFSLGYNLKKRPAYVGFDYYWEMMSLVEREHKDLTANPSTIVSDGYVLYNGFALTIKL